GHRVVVHGRNEAKGMDALARIRAHNPAAQVEFFCADFTSLAQVRGLAERINQLPQLHMLINNAGAMFRHRTETQDGFEATFAVNHLAPFLLTQLVLDKLKASGEARIINVASNAHKRAGPLNFADLMSKQSYVPFKVYCRSKLANMLFTRALARRLEGTAVTANCLHPGVVRSGFFANATPLMRAALWLVGDLLLISPTAGAKTILHLATREQLTASGQYFVHCAPKAPAKFALDDEACERLWQESERFTQLA
ncbi:MAG TPA: SDR family oxidoreductase, partial [Cellvibrionaceae bacterium]|nr:SDR family oxidoreductase [Cellvibrionaceae bacterium]